MIIEFGLTGEARKKLARDIGEIMECPAEYQYLPTYAYKIGNWYTVTKEGNLEICDLADSKEVEHLIDELVRIGYDVPMMEEPEECTRLTIQMPMESISEIFVDKLKRIIENKGNLFRAAFKTESLAIDVLEKAIDFPWFTPEQDGDSNAYCQFITQLCAFAENQKRVNSKPDTSDNPKYAMRCFLLRIGMIGTEFKAARKVLLRNLEGSSAFRRVGDSDAVSE